MTNQYAEEKWVFSFDLKELKKQAKNVGAPWNCCILAEVLCMPYNHALVYSVTLFEATYVGCMCV